MRRSGSAPRHGRKSRKRADRTPVARLRRLLRSAIIVQNYRPGVALARIRLLREDVEITCSNDELEAVLAFVSGALGATMGRDLPVREHRCGSWSRRYRWSLAASEIYLSALARREAAA